MDDEAWIRHVAEGRDRILPQLQALLPDIEFTSIMPGIFPIIYLQRRHGAVELGFAAVEAELDEEGAIQRVEVLEPPAEHGDEPAGLHEEAGS